MVTDELLAWVRQAALPEYEVEGELGRDRQARPVFLAREQPGARPLLLALEPAGRTPSGEEQYALTPVLRLEAVEAAAACASCGFVDPRGGRYCPACGAGIPDAARDAASERASFVAALAEQVPEYELLAEHAAGDGRLYFARNRTSGALETLHVVRDPARPDGEEYALEVTGAEETLQSGVLGALGPVSPAPGAGAPGAPTPSGKTLAFSAASLAALAPTPTATATPAPPARPAATAAAARQFGARERAARRARSRWGIAAAVGAVALLGGGAALAVRLRGAAGGHAAADSVVTADRRTDSLGVSGGRAPSVLDASAAEGRRPDSARPPLASRAAAGAAGRAGTTGTTVAPPAPAGGSAKPTPAKAAPALCERPGRSYNARHECYDDAPELINGVTDVPLPEDFVGTPLTSTMWLKISREGEVVLVEQDEPSTPEFERLAEAHARTLQFSPAQKGGRDVAGWVRESFRPVASGQ